jgi:hypothetical protein
MNAIKKMMASKEAKKTGDRTSLTLVRNEKAENKKEAEKKTKEYLNEKLYYFYINGGPVMDI